MFSVPIMLTSEGTVYAVLVTEMEVLFFPNFSFDTCYKRTFLNVCVVDFYYALKNSITFS